MEPMKLVLDTNAYSALMKGEKRIVSILETTDEIFIPTVVLGELYTGFQMGRYRDKNMKSLEIFLSKPGVCTFNITNEVAQRYGILVKTLKGQGTPIPTNDIWISAAALETGSWLVTRDRHFENIPGIYILPF